MAPLIHMFWLQGANYETSEGALHASQCTMQLGCFYLHM